MQQPPDTTKNTKALVATVLWHGVLLLFLVFVGFKIPQTPPPPQDLGIEVNLGNSDQGLGTNQPLSPGDPAPEARPKTAPAREQTPPSAQPHIETNDNNNDEQPAVTQPKKTKIVPKVPVVRETAHRVTQQTIVNPTPAPPRPKAQYKGGTGTGGNDQDAYNKSSNQGIAGGNGDQGKPNGDPNSNSYTGNGGTGHSGVIRGLEGRKALSIPSFQGDYNERSIERVDLAVDGSGRVVSATLHLEGSTHFSGYFAEKAVELARQIKFSPSGNDRQTGTYQIVFGVHE